MLTINNNPNSVFCPPEPGKPNPNEPRIPGQLRSRVVRQRQKGETCVYSGLQILLDETKTPKNERNRGEQLLSNHRKEIIAWTERWEPVRELVSAIYNSNIGFSREMALLLLQAAANQKDLGIISEQVQKFCTQQIYDDLALYINATKEEELERIHTRLLEEIHYPENQIEEYCQSTFGVPLELARNPYAYLSQIPAHQHQQILQTATHVRSGLLHGLYVRVAKEVYGLEISTWNPEKPITELIKELQLHGPHLVFATLGKPIYITSPIPLKDKIEGRTIFGWTPNAARHEGSGSHTIVIVGAEVVNNRGYVYFVDPDTASSDRNSQEIFKVSYDRLLSSIHDLRQRNDALRRQQIQEGNGRIVPFINEYALYCPKK